MKTKIKINSILGKLLFEYESENNTIKNTLIKAIHARTDLTGAYLTRADLTGADLTGADLTGADLTGADLTGTDLTGAYLTGADLTGTDLTGANLRGAYLRGANLAGAYLRGADLRGTDLRGTDLTGAYLRGADLRGANLAGADLRGANLAGANLAGANDEIISIKKIRCISGLYSYDCAVILTEKNEKYIKLGCFTRKLEDWKNDFWNNENEFKPDYTEKSNLRVLAFNTCNEIFKIWDND